MISIHKALAGLDAVRFQASIFLQISIHKALAGLDIIIIVSAPR